MKAWQLINIIADDVQLRQSLEFDDYQVELSVDYTLEILTQSRQRFTLCKDGNIRMEKSKYGFDIEPIEELSAVEAFKRYGGNALCEVIDYGSYPLDWLKK